MLSTPEASLKPRMTATLNTTLAHQRNQKSANSTQMIKNLNFLNH
jgi:hypothetical protein